MTTPLDFRVLVGKARGRYGHAVRFGDAAQAARERSTLSALVVERHIRERLPDLAADDRARLAGLLGDAA